MHTFRKLQRIEHVSAEIRTHLVRIHVVTEFREQHTVEFVDIPYRLLYSYVAQNSHNKDDHIGTAAVGIRDAYISIRQVVVVVGVGVEGKVNRYCMRFS